MEAIMIAIVISNRSELIISLNLSIEWLSGKTEKKQMIQQQQQQQHGRENTFVKIDKWFRYSGRLND